ncbi:MAG: ankyrin repeat domain-containing protein [Bacteroidota bacterium]
MMNALKDRNSDVRSAALEALRTLVEKGADVQLLVTPILNALQHSDWIVREAALQALRALVAKGADVQLLLPPMLNALQDSVFDVRSTALQALGQISTESFINYYWNKKDKGVISALVPRRYEVALTVEDTRDSSQQQLVLHLSTGNPVKWTKTREEVRSFIELVFGSMLLKAAQKGDLPTVQYFYERGANLTVLNKAGFTPLERAAYACHPEVAKYLLKHSAGEEVPADHPLLIAIQQGPLTVVQYLRDNNSRVFNPDLDAYNILHMAAEDGQLEIVQLLVEQVKMDVHAKNPYGYTPLDLAKRQNRKEVVEYLESHLQ